MSAAGAVVALASDVPADALLAARLCAVDPHGLGGLLLRGADRASREALLAALQAALPPGAPVRRLPAHADDAQLLGGIDLGAALAGRGACFQPGLLGQANGGMIVVPMAERLPPATAAHLGAALDRGELAIERDGVARTMAARFLVVALDDGVGDERVPAALAERLAFHIDLSAPAIERDDAEAAESADDAARKALAAVSAALGISSARATLFAWRAARASARLAGRTGVSEVDVAIAARLVLGPRATRLPSNAEDAAAEPPPPAQSGDADSQASGEGGALEDRVLAAAQATLPADLLMQLAGGPAPRGPGRQARGAGDRRRSLTRGRPAGVRAGVPGGGRRLALVETLRAAAPWQRLRGRTDRVLVRRDDLRVRRYAARAELVTILAVDASGSAAMARLAEAKGAAELLLAQAYVQRSEVALLAFRGGGAELLLPATRSLTRARRALAELPGGGGTPLAAGLIAAHAAALAARGRGRTAFVVLLSDGRGNIAADGSHSRAAAERDALAAARALAADGIAAVFVDTSTRARPQARELAEAMGARYLALPHAGAAAVQAAVSAFAPDIR